MKSFVKYFVGQIAQHPLVLITSVGFGIRFLFITNSDFPLNDGGMFYTMTKDLIKNHLGLPTYTSYNQSGIPFVYPPFPLYLTAFLNILLKVDLFFLFRIVPLVNTTLTIPLVYLIAERLFSKKTAAFSASVFAILPRSFEWEIMGGGLTRSFGMLFYLTTIYLFFRDNGITKGLDDKSSKKHSLSFLSLGLCIMSHLEWAAYALVTTFVISLVEKIDIRRSLTMIGASMVVSAVWWVPVVMRHGILPFISFASNGISLGEQLSYNHAFFLDSTDEVYLSVFGTLGLLGLLREMFSKKWLLPLWLFVPLFISQRGAPNLISIPISILAGKLISDVFGHSKTPVTKYAIYTTIIYGILSTISFFSFKLEYRNYISALDHKQLEAMAWVKDNTDTRSQFLLITNRPGWHWASDNVSEWFPAIAERKSILTAQGLEWLPDNEFEKVVNLYFVSKNCYNKSLDCLEEVLENSDKKYDYIYLTSDDAGVPTELIKQLIKKSPRLTHSYSNDGVDIYQIKGR